MSDTINPGVPQMRAVIVRHPGGPEQLAVASVAAPRLAAGCVEIEVRASALNRADLLQRRGLYAPPPGASDILGLECAGVVRSVASDVTTSRIGERVMALLPGGGYAERVVVSAGLVMPIPTPLSFVEAAALPEAFLTASEALFTHGRVQKDSWVLVHAAAGGVGAAAVQLARAVGARSLASVGSAEKVAWVQKLGANRALNYRDVDFADECLAATEQRGVDVILDFIGASHAERHQRCLAEEGRWVVIGLLGGAQASIDLGKVLRRRLTLSGLIMRSRPLADKQAIVQRFGQRFLPLFETGALGPNIDRVYALSEVRAAHERMEQNENLGKIVLDVTR